MSGFKLETYIGSKGEKRRGVTLCGGRQSVNVNQSNRRRKISIYTYIFDALVLFVENIKQNSGSITHPAWPIYLKSDMLKA